MAQIYTSVEQLIGHTPLLAADTLTKELGISARVLTKIECMNPCGSTKDRAALSMLDDAQARGILTPDSVIIEPTSGNTGIGLACIGVSRGYRVIIVMPDSMSVERQRLMTAYGAELVLTEGGKGMAGAIAKAEELAQTYPNSFIPSQFDNPANAQAHFTSTGPELWNDTDGNVDIFVAGVGTGGTITGVGRYLKSKNPNVQIVAVEPADSPVLSGGQADGHKLQGIGAGFVPAVLDTNVYDSVMPVTTEQAFQGARLFAKHQGILVGISSGAALWAALELGKKPVNAGKTIAVLLPDTGERYLSTPLFVTE
ncbi:cysteine synthase A [Bengtsoniella intestinalis]|uniref:cysteine synthase A n=1 Tax=Bengtsoniella intestinalis TaxID=3073143 RepID=UPI00391F0D12